MPDILHLLSDHIATPIGKLTLIADHDGNLRAIDWHDHEHRIHHFLRLHYGEHGCHIEAAHNPHGLSDTLVRYFNGDLTAINSLPTKTAGTPFQREVWRALREIPAGTTTSYGQLAQRIGCPSAVRAVGLANGSNPISIVVPCHRVIGSNGTLTGYGGGLYRKRWLLDHESPARRLSF
jgi:methylated-DNA-[protein]-cysteine S-methyltransferase